MESGAFLGDNILTMWQKLALVAVSLGLGYGVWWARQEFLPAHRHDPVKEKTWKGKRAQPPIRGLATFLPNLVKNEVPVRRLRSGSRIALELERDWKLNEKAPSWLGLYEVQGQEARSLAKFEHADLAKDLTVELPNLKNGQSYRLQGTFYYCKIKKSSVCLIKSYDQDVVADPQGVAVFGIRLVD